MSEDQGSRLLLKVHSGAEIMDGVKEKEEIVAYVFEHDKATNELIIDVKYPYPLDLDPIKNTNDLLFKLHHMLEKNWFDSTIAHELIEQVCRIKGWKLYGKAESNYHNVGALFCEFFMPMEPPTATFQQHRIVTTKGGKTGFYDTHALAQARAKLKANLSQNIPGRKAYGPLRLITKWCFASKTQPDGTWKTTKPDTDNLQKMLKDLMTKLDFWSDDAQVCSEITEKFLSKRPGIFIRIEELD